MFDGVGYRASPLTVERGEIVLAAFGGGDKPLPGFPKWPIDGTQPRRLSSNGMFKGREWRIAPQHELPPVALQKAA